MTLKYVNEFRNHELAQKLVEQLHASSRKPCTIMEVCGGQTHTILQYGIQGLLPKTVDLVHGPGCPVCVTPIEMIDKAIAIARQPNIILCTFGDMLRVPGSQQDLAEVKALGADVRVLYSPLDALRIAQQNPHKQIVMFAVGFETTAPANAMALWQAKRLGLRNFSAVVSHVTVPPIMSSLLESEDNAVQAFIGPGHVCTIMGISEYQHLSAKYRIPIVISGFEPIDLLDGILRCVVQLEHGQHIVENRYARSVREDGSARARELMESVFELTDRNWRGLGFVTNSGYKLSSLYAEFDAEARFGVSGVEAQESSLCISGQILRGLKKPHECPAFGKECTPETPLGATMVSGEGTCTNYYKFHRSENSL